ncbi:MAG TPA: DUF4440 domain-containing protein [Pirellulales bacterium]|nr:DUF4440 domain-containing protein [Pirellulales bacterium]
MANLHHEIVRVTQQLLESIVAGDWATYEQLCDPTLSCFEPESRGHLVEGMAFHKFYFDLEHSGSPRTTTIASPHVRALGSEAAVISYVRLTQSIDLAGQPATAAVEETRVWQRSGGAWKHVHFHRSPA